MSTLVVALTLAVGAQGDSDSRRILATAIAKCIASRGISDLTITQEQPHGGSLVIAFSNFNPATKHFSDVRLGDLIELFEVNSTSTVRPLYGAPIKAPSTERERSVIMSRIASAALSDKRTIHVLDGDFAIGTFINRDVYSAVLTKLGGRPGSFVVVELSKQFKVTRIRSGM